MRPRAALRFAVPGVLALLALVSCAAGVRRAASRTQELRPGVRFTIGALGDSSDPALAPHARLVCRMTDERGAPVWLVPFALPGLGVERLTDDLGSARFPALPPGDWTVLWHVTGAPADSIRIHLETGSADTLDVRTRPQRP